MRIVCQTFSLPKEGREFSDYEDACFPSSSVNIASHVEEHAQTEIFRTAVCDGATDSCFSKYWAQLLAASYGSGEWAENVSDQSLVADQASWKKYVDQQDLPWYAEEKVKLGAFAAFLGLTLVEEGQLWKSVAIGDCCLFHTRNGELIDCFPLTKSADFSNFPFLLGSLKERNGGVFEEKQTRLNGQWQSGDIFFLMSDALACWFMRCVEGGAGGQLVSWMTQLSTHEPFAQMVHNQRTELGADSAPNMKDDDVTLVKIWVADKNAAPPVVQARASAAAASTNTSAKSSAKASGNAPAGSATNAPSGSANASNNSATNARSSSIANQPREVERQATAAPETMRMGAVPRRSSNEDIDRTAMLDKPNKFSNANNSQDDSASKASRRGTSERAARRQTRDEIVEKEADEDAPYSRKKPGALQSSRQKNILITACVLLVVGVGAVGAWLKNAPAAKNAPATNVQSGAKGAARGAAHIGTEGEANSTPPDASENAALDAAQGPANKSGAPIVDVDQTDNPAAAFPNNHKHASAKHAGKHHGGANPTLSVPLSDLPIRHHKSVNAIPDDAYTSPTTQNP